MSLKWLPSIVRRAVRDLVTNAFDERYWPTYDSVTTAAGVTVSADRPTISAVYRCGALLSEAVAGLPGGVKRRLERGREDVPDHEVNRIFWRKPNPYQNEIEFKSMMMWHAIFRGSAFARIVQGPEGIELWPLHPSRVQGPELMESGRLRYTYTAPDGTQSKVFAGLDLFVYNGLSSNGIRGMALIDMARDTFGIAQATEQYGAQLFSRQARFSGALKLPAGRTIGNPKARTELSESIRRAGAGSGNWHGIPIFEDGMEWQSISMTNDDAQFLETRKFTVADIARWFGIPPHMIGDVERTTSWGTGIEGMATQFVQYGLMPWVKRMEAAIRDTFLMEPDEYVHFNVDGLLRGDSEARHRLYEIGIRNGMYSPNDCRELEDRNPREGGDVYVTPTAPQQAKDAASKDAGEQQRMPMPKPGAMPMDDGEEKDGDEEARAALAALVTQLADRIEQATAYQPEDKRKAALEALRSSADALGVPQTEVRRLLAHAKAKE